MRQIITAILLLISLGFVGSSYAYTQYGSGIDSCGSWIKWRKTKSGWHQEGQWVSGFISAAGYYGRNLKKVDSYAMLAFMDNYCQQNPLSTISDGAKSLADELELK